MKGVAALCLTGHLGLQHWRQAHHALRAPATSHCWKVLLDHSLTECGRFILAVLDVLKTNARLWDNASGHN
eukprot:CAMPEP_0180487842 /NCGR_PEP_ID=MMETSP1036_2-20121128/37733_1 /TAXON_ID=632150 /ORGANISM="Azadinium spinosum, Strain 3D9" /LENGTH=70 /DNA_ID=CAMNT_0022495867 /DNA_START=128 /DNA_END=340 /DNA_ORIENTATION=+